jgi:hypothetical protein
MRDREWILVNDVIIVGENDDLYKMIFKMRESMILK